MHEKPRVPAVKKQLDPSDVIEIRVGEDQQVDLLRAQLIEQRRGQADTILDAAIDDDPAAIWHVQHGALAKPGAEEVRGEHARRGHRQAREEVHHSEAASLGTNSTSAPQSAFSASASLPLPPRRKPHRTGVAKRWSMVPVGNICL
jgi:hypothetical protein